MGRIGRAARHAELPPEEVTAAIEKIDQAAALHPPAVVPNAGIVAPTTGTPTVPFAAAPAAPRAAPTARVVSNQQPVPIVTNPNQVVP